jgi:hypothetical protein
MERWLPIFGLIFLAVSLVFIALLAGQHAKRGWKDHRWIWGEANDKALLFGLAFATLAGGHWLSGSPRTEVVIFGWIGLGFVALPYIAYITGRLLGMWHRSRQHRTLS